MSIDQSSQKKIVKDSMGELEIDHEALYAAQTQRAINNFPVSGRRLPKRFIEALILIKLNAAKANKSLKCIDGAIADSIVENGVLTRERESLFLTLRYEKELSSTCQI